MLGVGNISGLDLVFVVREAYMLVVNYNLEWKMFGKVLSIVICLRYKIRNFSKKME